MRYLHLLVAVIFMLFAYWQFNDPDWYIWIPAYLLVAIITGWQSFGGAPRKFIAFTMGLLVAWLLVRIPDLIDWLRNGTPSIVQEMKAESPHIELTREFLGLAICLGTLSIYYFKLGKRGEN